jgi:two-component system, OmpR family, sensor kinase
MKFFSTTRDAGRASGQKDASVTSENRAFFREIDIEFLIHELKDPISIIETGMRTLLERTDRYGSITGKQEKTLQRSLRSCRRAQSMLNHLLEIGRSQSGCFSSTCFNPSTVLFEVVMDAIEAMAWEIFEASESMEDPDQKVHLLSQNGIVLDIPPEIRSLKIDQDEVKFRQIAGNLIKNALHHRKEKVDIRLRSMEDRIMIEVADDGPGIDPEHHQTIFERYTRLKECTLPTRSGHGLGLAGARIIARCLGGDIRVTSERGNGATFELMLPISFQGPIT